MRKSKSEKEDEFLNTNVSQCMGCITFPPVKTTHLGVVVGGACKCFHKLIPRSPCSTDRDLLFTVLITSSTLFRNKSLSLIHHQSSQWLGASIHSDNFAVFNPVFLMSTVLQIMPNPACSVAAVLLKLHASNDVRYSSRLPSRVLIVSSVWSRSRCARNVRHETVVF